MQNLNSSYQSGPATNNNTSRGGEDFQRLFHRLRDLNEVQDESRNELCPVFLDEESLIKTRRESQWSVQQVPTQVNILKELEDTAQPTPKHPLSKRSHYDVMVDQELRESNRRLQEDNKKLFAECVRLRKLCRIQEGASSESIGRREGEEKALRQQLTELSAQNAQLAAQVKQAEEQLASLRHHATRCDQLSSQLQQASRVNDELVGRIVSLQRQLEAVSRSSSKSTQSINNSTQESRKAEVEKDRLISNMKIVHESQKLKLKNTIEELRKELSRNSQSPSFSNVASGRKK